MPRDPHQAPLEQAAQDGTGVHAAHVLDLGARHRLLVGDHREGLERSTRQAQRRLRLEVLHEGASSASVRSW